MAPKLTDKLYKQLFKVALYICHQKEDNAAECVNQVILNLDKYTAGDSDDEFFGWARRIITNKKNDLYHKQKNDILILNQELFDIQLDTVPEPGKIEEKKNIKEFVTNKDFIWALDYVNSDRIKTAQEKCRFHRLKKKITSAWNIDKTIKEEKKYTATLIDGSIELFDTTEQLAKRFGRTSQAIRYAIEKQRPLKIPEAPLITKNF